MEKERNKLLNQITNNYKVESGLKPYLCLAGLGIFFWGIFVSDWVKTFGGIALLFFGAIVD